MISTDEVIDEPVVGEPQQETGQPTPPNKKLYDKLANDKLYTKSYEEFQKQFSTPEAIQKLHQKLNTDGLYTKSKEDFQQQFFPTPKPVAQSSTPIPQEHNSYLQPKPVDYMHLTGTDEEFKQRAVEEHAQKLNDAHQNVVKNLQDVHTTAEKYLNSEEYKYGKFKEKYANANANDFYGQPADPELANPATPEQIQQVASDPNNIPVLLNAKAKQLEQSGKKQDAANLKSDAYLLASNQRGGDMMKQRDNADKIKSGDLEYNAANDKLIKPENFGESFHTSIQKRNEDMDLFDLADKGNKADLIKKLNEITGSQDPDNPTPVPSGWGKLGDFMGGQGKVMTEVGAAQALNYIPVVGEKAAEAVTGGLFAHEMGRRGFATELVRSYSEFKKNGLSDNEAADKAQTQATRAMYADAAVAGLMGSNTSKAGSKFFKPAIKDLVKVGAEDSWANGVAKNLYGFVKQEAPAGLKNAALSSSGELAKNISANQLGANRDEGENVLEAGANMLALHYTMASTFAILGKGVEKSATLYKKGLQVLSKLPIEDVKAIAQDQIKDGIVTPQEAASNIQAIEEHKEIDALIPKSVKNDEVRLKLQDIVKKREATAEEKSRVSAAFAEPLKLKIEGYDQKISDIVNSPEAKEESPKQEPSKISVIRPEDNTKPNIVGDFKKPESVSVINPHENARPNIVELKSEAKPIEGEAVKSTPEPVTPETATAVEPISKEDMPVETVSGGKGSTAITHAAMNETAKEFGLPEYEGSPEKITEWNEQADARLQKPESLPNLFNKLRDGGMPDKVETMMMIKYMADLKAKLEVDPKSDELLTQLKRAKDLFNVAGREQGKSFRARQEYMPTEKTLPDFLLRDMEMSKVDKLTDAQKEQATKEHAEISSADKDLSDKVSKLEVENAKLKADKAVKKVVSETPKTKKTHEDYVKERKTFVEQLKELKAAAEKKMNDRGIQTMGVSFTFNGEMAKVVGKMVKSLAEEGIDKLEEIVKRVHEQLKDVFEGIQEKDVHDIIAGEYNERKSTKSELAAKVEDFRIEAQLINKLEKLESGGEPKGENAKVKRNKEITELRSKIESLKKAKSQSEAIENRVSDMEAELERVQKRKQKAKEEKNTPEEKVLTERESDLKSKIETENKEWQKERENAATEKANYRKLETERNRQLDKVETLKSKIEALRKGVKETTESKLPKKDTPEIERLKAELKVEEAKFYEKEREKESVKKLNAELDRVSRRKAKVSDKEPAKEKIYTPAEQSVLDKIAAEQKAWDKEKADAAEADKQYSKLETERNRQLSRVADLKEKLAQLKDGTYTKTKTDKKVDVKEIEDLKKQVSDAEKEFNRINTEARKAKEKIDGTEEKRKLNSIRKRNEDELKIIQDKIAAGDFGPDEKKVPMLDNPELKKKFPELVKAAIEAKDKLVAAKIDREVRLIKQKYAHETKWETFKRVGGEIGNMPRTIMSSMDFSAPLRQGLVAVAAHPIIAAKVMAKMFEAAASKKVFDRWFHDLRENPEFKIMEKSGLAITDPHDPRLAAKEEAFMNNIAQKIPFAGTRLIAGSERAYVLFLNKIRADIFNQGVEAFEANGKTFENNPELYKALASHVNNITGRGGLHPHVEVASPLLNSIFFAPRLVSSRINLLTNFMNPKFYMKVPKEVRKMYFKDMAKFILFGTSLLGLSAAAGAGVEPDPRSSDGLKVKVGDTRYDILGGFQQYIRLVSEMAMGNRKSAKTGEMQDLNGQGAFGETRGAVLGRFVRSKLSPVPGMALDALSGRDLMGNKIVYDQKLKLHSPYQKEKTWIEEYGGNMLPLIANDISDAFEKQGIKSVATVGLPAAFGVGTMTYSKDNRPKRPSEVPSKKSSHADHKERTARQ